MSGQKILYMTKTSKQEVYKYGHPFYCEECGEDAMYMDKNQKWWCYFNWTDMNKEHYGICKNKSS